MVEEIDVEEEDKDKTNKTVTTRTINMNSGYKARNIQTVSDNVAHMTTNNYNKSFKVTLKSKT